MHEFGRSVPLWAVLPFAAMLLGIAILPLVATHWWESNRNRAIFVAAVSAPMVAYLLVVFPEGLLHSGEEYLSFIALLGALYIVAGGIHLSGDLRATPTTNTGILALGAVLANLIGTTGASMLLIRTLLSTNKQRRRTEHLPFFFILIVSNCGGLLTPMGDPPLFLGYLRGVPFVWTLGLWPYWLLACGYLLAVFYVIDARAYRQEERTDIDRDQTEHSPLRLTGWIHVPLLAGVISAIFLETPYRELAMGAIAVASVLLGPRQAREDNGFTYGPILEVAILFVGVFITMVPALALLEARGDELGLREPWQFFLVTGSLSSMLDNAPTYLTFLATAIGLHIEDPGTITWIDLHDGRVPEVFLTAISTGAVFMGANTYIGNGPNFMVKAIAEENSYRMPSFFTFMVRAALTLAPVYLVMCVVLAWLW
ncbi:MAG: sodium:proton antiporter [Sandaracinaceae bacterium]